MGYIIVHSPSSLYFSYLWERSCISVISQSCTLKGLKGPYLKLFFYGLTYTRSYLETEFHGFSLAQFRFKEISQSLDYSLFTKIKIDVSYKTTPG